jgi:hypothetical protein
MTWNKNNNVKHNQVASHPMIITASLLLSGLLLSIRVIVALPLLRLLLARTGSCGSAFGYIRHLFTHSSRRSRQRLFLGGLQLHLTIHLQNCKEGVTRL